MSVRSGTRKSFGLGFVIALLMLSEAATISAQMPAPDRIDFDRPEAWAMKYFTSASLLAPPSEPVVRAPQTWLGLDLVWLPALTAAQQRVGFNGTAQEDLNQAPVFVRPRVDVALSDKWSLSAAGLPPVHVFGITPRLLALGITWYATGRDARWTLSLFGHGQIGSVTGAITCPADVLRFSVGSDGNPRGCEAASADVTTLRYASVDLDVDHALDRSRRWTVHGSFGANLVDGMFQTNAHTFGFVDRTRLTSQGLTYDGSLGVRYTHGRFERGADVLYAPLTIRRPSAPVSLDSLVTVRNVVMYRVH